MKIKEASMVTTAVMFLIAIATFFVGKVSSQKSDRKHRIAQERKKEEVTSKYREKNELERVYHEQEIKDLHEHYKSEEDILRHLNNLPARDQ